MQINKFSLFFHVFFLIGYYCYFFNFYLFIFYIVQPIDPMALPDDADTAVQGFFPWYCK